MTREEIVERLLQGRAPAQITVNPMKQRIERQRDFEDASTYEYDPFNPDMDPRGPPPVMGGYPVAGIIPTPLLDLGGAAAVMSALAKQDEYRQ